jgi:Cyclic nucleotide-binding domain
LPSASILGRHRRRRGGAKIAKYCAAPLAPLEVELGLDRPRQVWSLPPPGGVLAVAKRSEPNGKWVILHGLMKGDTAGELAFMDGKPHYAALVATGPTRVFSLEREKLESLLERHPQIVYRVMRAICRIVHGILHRMAFQTTELTNYIYKQHGKY